MSKIDPASYPSRVIPGPQRPGPDRTNIFATLSPGVKWAGAEYVIAADHKKELK